VTEAELPDSGSQAELGSQGITRGDLAQAEAMLKKSLGLFQDIGATPQVELVQGLLKGLRHSD